MVEASGARVRGRPGSRMFASLAIFNYRSFFLGALISNIGTWMQRVALDWLVLTELTDRSSSAVGIGIALQFLGIPLLAPLTGAVADRFPKRKVLLVTQSLLGVHAVALFVLVVTGSAQLWNVYVLAFTQGIVAAFDGPARQAFVSEMVPETMLPNAVALNSTSFNGARLIGPGVAGLIIGAWGVPWTLLINAISFLAMMMALILMRGGELHPAPVRRGRGSAIEGLRYIKGRPDIVTILVIVFMLGTFGMNFQLNNATMATKVFGKGAEEFGLLGTMIAVGTLAGALTATRRQRPRIRILIAAVAAFSVFATLLALAPNFTVYSLLLIPVGFCMLTVITTANSAIQMSTEPVMRGRVMAVYLAIFQGGTPIGAPFVGWIGDVLGPRWSILVGPIATSITLVVVLGWYRTHHRMRLRLERGWPPRLYIWSTAETVAAQAGDSTAH